MKKVLYSTTALVAAGMLAFSGGDANAAAHAKKAKKKKATKMVIKTGGFMKMVMGFAEQDSKFESTANSTSRGGYDSFDVKKDSELYFTGSTKLDNGIAVSVVIQLETDHVTAHSVSTATDASGAPVDESYIKLTGAFGDIRIGSTKAAGFVLKHRAPVVGAVTHDGGDAKLWIHRPANTGPAGPALESAGTHLGAGDNVKVVYITNKFAGGFRVGASYEPTNENSQYMPQTGGNSGTEAQRYDVIVSYENTLGAVKVQADLGYDEIHGVASESTNAWRGGLVLGFGGISFGGSYRTVSNMDSGFEGTANSDEQDTFDLGVSYATGPFKFSISGMSSEMPFSSTVQGDDEVSHVGLGVAYNMGPGVDFLGTVFHRQWNEEQGGDPNDNDGWAIVGGIKVSF